ncbi:PREDICTED: myoD family inhibitor domain-containing protein-like, partial [Pterocles gutturalis]|uniref:myoD family inhibitor domain-containing protein-like n=1 Tax=Pterocles gutturalis TaxID=240206 RepID=UPI000528531A
MEAVAWLTCHQPGRAAVAEDGMNAFVGLKACETKGIIFTGSSIFTRNSQQSDICTALREVSQPQRLPQPNTSALERGEEESGKIQNGHAGPSNGSGIHNGVKHMPADNRKLSAPVSEKMHRKIQSTLSVNSNSSKKSKINSAFSQKPGTSPE